MSLLVASSLSLLPTVAGAAVTGVSATPASENVAVSRSTSIPVNWSVTTNSAGSVTLSSAQGVFRTSGGTLLGTVSQPLARVVSGPTTATIQEAVLVPADIVVRAVKEGQDRILYQRTFTDGASATGQISLNIVTSGAASFGISALSLNFGEDRALHVAKRGEEFSARAEIGFTGTGVLKGAWEVAGPQPNPDKPLWRKLATVNLALTGVESATLTSPRLPSDVTGSFLVRLRIDEPALGTTPPVVRYSVIDKR
jgi:hypothetical protein